MNMIGKRRLVLPISIWCLIIVLSTPVFVQAKKVAPPDVLWKPICKAKGARDCNNSQSQAIGDCQEEDACTPGGCYYMSKANSRAKPSLLFWKCFTWAVDVPDWWGYCGGWCASLQRDCVNVQPHVHTSPTAAVASCDILLARSQSCGMTILQTGHCACVEFSLGGSPASPIVLCNNSYDCWKASGQSGCKVRYNSNSCGCKNHICMEEGDSLVVNDTGATVDPCNCVGGDPCATNDDGSDPLSEGFCYCWKPYVH